MGGIGEVLLYILGEQLAEKGIEYIIDTVTGEDGEGGGTIIRWGTDDDGDGDFDEPFEIFVPNAEATVEKSIIIMSQDGTMTVYDENGNITSEDCDTAYSLWVSENGVMDKDINNYSVSEGMLLLLVLLGLAWFVRSLFKGKDVFR